MCDRLWVTRRAATPSCYSRQGEKGEQSREVSLRCISHERSEVRRDLGSLFLSLEVGLERVCRAVPLPLCGSSFCCAQWCLPLGYPVFAVLHCCNYFLVILVLFANFFFFFFNFCLTVVTTQMLQLFSRLTY